MKQKKLVKTVILVLSAAMIGGCGAQGSNQGDSQAVQETSAAVSESQSSSDGAYEPVTIVNGEREITFTKMPQKVLCANLYAAENMVMLGLGRPCSWTYCSGESGRAPSSRVGGRICCDSGGGKIP